MWGVIVAYMFRKTIGLRFSEFSLSLDLMKISCPDFEDYSNGLVRKELKYLLCKIQISANYNDE